MAKSSAEPVKEDPNVALGRWLAQRQGAKSEYSKVLNERENELLEASARCGPKSSRFEDTAGELEEAKLQREEIYGVVRRPLNRHAVRFGYLALFVVLLAFLESLVNKFLFDVTLGSYGIVSYATAFVVSFSMVIVAHMAGKFFRQIYSDYRSKIVWSYLVTGLLIVCGLVVLVSIITVGRSLTAANAAIGSFDDMFSAVTASVVQKGILSTVAGAFSELSGLILATVNIAGIFAAMLLGFLMHDPDKDYDLAETKVERLRRNLDKLNDAYTKAKSRLLAKYASHLSAASTRFKAANKQVMQLKHRLGVAADEDDHLLIDEWDDLAEKSGLIESEPNVEDLAPEPKSPHLKPVDFEARRA